MPRPLRSTPCSGSRNSYQLVGHRRTAGGRFNALSRRLDGGSTQREVKFGGWQRRAAGNFASSISHIYERNVEYNGMLSRRLGSRVGSVYSAYIPRSTWRIGLGKNAGCKCSLKSPRMVMYPRELEPQFLISAPFLLAPLLALLKSSTILKSVAALSRISFTLIAPLRLGGRRFLRWWHGPDYDVLHPPPHLHDFSNGSRPIKPKHFRRTTLVLVYGPLLLLVIGLLASLERTPVWGRWRVIMLSDAEEVEAMREILAIEIQQDDGSASKALPASNGPIKRKRNWLPILRVILGEESNSGVQNSDDRTLLGFRVLGDDDWRVKWVQDVLNRLETGIIECNIFSDPSGNVSSEGHRKKRDGGDDANRDSTAESLGKAGTNYRIPPVKIPIELRSALLEYLGVERDSVSLDSLLNNYGLVVVDNPQSEAFCFGFGPGLKTGPKMEGNAENQLQMHDEALGVVVVYTGLLNEIIAMDSAGSVEIPTASSPTNSLPFPFNAFVKSAPPHEVLPPTETQAARLAVVLSHELSHLLLSHSLESLTATDFYFLLGNLSTDLLRTLLYPLTALLGPIVNDWLGEQIRIPTGLGLNIRSSCESRKAETEADLLGLRILQGAGYDPKVALSVWGPNGLFERIRKKQREEEAEGEKVKASDRKGEDLSVEKGNGGASGSNEDKGADSESEDWGTWLEKSGWLHSHPPDEVRYRRIKEELASWAV